MRVYLCRTEQASHFFRHFKVDRLGFTRCCSIAGNARKETFGCDSSHAVAGPLCGSGGVIIA